MNCIEKQTKEDTGGRGVAVRSIGWAICILLAANAAQVRADDAALKAMCVDGINLEFFCPEVNKNVVIEPDANGYGTFVPASIAFGQSYDGHRLLAKNFKQYWFKNCRVKYDGVLADENESEVHGEQKFGDAAPYTLLVEKQWYKLSLGVTAQHKEYYPGFLPEGVAKYYNFPTDLKGKGQSIAIISLGGKMDLKELAGDFKKMGFDKMPNISVVDVGTIPAAQDSDSTGETHLDVEVIGSICPEAKITIYRGSRTTDDGFAKAISKAVADKNTVISISWGGTEYSSFAASTIETALKGAKDAGITVCVATGDGASANKRNFNHAIPGKDGNAHCQFPACSQYVLACGGTDIEFVDSQKNEVVWNNANRDGGATGGGVSAYIPLPGWQSAHGIGIKNANDATKTGRVIPDVAGLAAFTQGADWSIYENDRKIPNGGTSAVAPLWASLIALANEKRANLKPPKRALGFINEALYELAANGDIFNDITDGHNKPIPKYTGYTAAKGFDACTGWGTPKASALINALAKLSDDGKVEPELVASSGGGAGALPGFSAPDMRKGFSDTPPSSSAPSWRVAGYGISIEYDCRNCGKAPIIIKGMVNNVSAFDLVHGNTCPVCKARLKATDYSGYWGFQCNFAWDGVLANDDEEVVKGAKAMNDNLLHKTMGEPVQYFKLQITTRPL